MIHQQDHVTCIQVSNLVGCNDGKDLVTTCTAINPISGKFQSLKSAHDWIHERRYTIFFFMCVIALWLDPLFCYSLVINDDKKCLRVDKNLGTIAIVLRSVMDFLYLIHVISECRTEFSLPRENGRVVVHKAAWAITKRYPIDILSVLPLPQVMLLIIIPRVIDKGFLNTTKALHIFFVFFQYVPRVIRIYPLFKTYARTSGILIGSAILNLNLYMLASHVVGAFWYLFAVERKAMCWQEACKNRIGCVSLSCDDILEDYTFLTDYCPIKTPNATIFDFGIFLEALDSGIVDSTGFLRKFSCSFWFGLQSLSSLGQNLETSTYFWEIIFAVIISIFGLILLVFLIGSMQIYLQFKMERLEEMKLTGEQIEIWLALHSLPRNLKKLISKHKQHKWRGADNFLHNLPKEIRRDTMRHLYLDVLKKVPLLQKIDEEENLSDAIFDHLKQVVFVEHSYVVREGDPLNEMLFITRGTLLLYTSNRSISTVYLEKDDSYGEELLTWAMYSPSLPKIPFSTKTVYAQTKVEAVALMANDLKIIVSKFWPYFRKELHLSPSFNLEISERRAVSAVQAAWRRSHKKKQADNAHAQEARSAERIPPTVPQQPAEPETIAE